MSTNTVNSLSIYDNLLADSSHIIQLKGHINYTLPVDMLGNIDKHTELQRARARAHTLKIHNLLREIKRKTSAIRVHYYKLTNNPKKLYETHGSNYTLNFFT